MKVCVVTSSRSDFGLLRPLLKKLKRDSRFSLMVVATGAHLSDKHGHTINEIHDEGIEVTRTVDISLGSDSPQGILKSFGTCAIGFGAVLEELQPDLLTVLGDRYEILSVTFSALVYGIPIAHISGGDLTEGAIDDSIRHSITKMSHLHFVSTESYRTRVIQLGEPPERVFNVGSLGVEAAMAVKTQSRSEIEERLNFKFLAKNVLVTLHPETVCQDRSQRIAKNLIAVLASLSDVGIIFTAPCADAGSDLIKEMIERFCTDNSNARLYASLGQDLYLSCVNTVDCVIGNSSSGLIEVPAMQKKAIDIGDRQAGRIRGPGVIHVGEDEAEIRNALEVVLNSLESTPSNYYQNPYGNGSASDQIVAILAKIIPETLAIKRFHDLQFKH